MMGIPLIVSAFREPAVLCDWDVRRWDLLLRQLRQANMTSSLYELMDARGLLHSIPAQPLRHLNWAAQLSERHRNSVQYEVAAIWRALESTGVQIVLLKGAAYVMAQLPNFAGRIFSDIDILVAKEHIDEVESALMMAGWHSSHHDEYDQRYYRVWMHELPPMTHVKRGTMIDVHHAILPITARLQPDSDKLLRSAVPLAGHAHLFTLANTDMVLHSVVHLFYNGEFEHGFRDLADIHNLLRQFSEQPQFCMRVVPRAVELELTRPLFYALRYVSLFFQTPIPFEVMQQADVGRPNALLLALMDPLFERALLPHHVSCQDQFSGLANFLLYIRGNWLRMPPLLLVRHLFHKAFISKREAVAAKPQ